jgi:hypothetical protein
MDTLVAIGMVVNSLRLRNVSLQLDPGELDVVGLQPRVVTEG